MNSYFSFCRGAIGFLNNKEKPTLRRGKEYSSLVELWEEHNETFSKYNIDYFHCNEKNILNIVNYKYYDSENPYLLDFNSAADICCFNDKTTGKFLGLDCIEDYLSPKLRESRVMVVFMYLYIKIIGNLYNENMGGYSKKINNELDYYFEYLKSAYIHILEYLTHKGEFEYTTLEKNSYNRKISTLQGLMTRYPKYFPNGIDKYRRCERKILEIVNNKYTVSYCRYLIPYVVACKILSDKDNKIDLQSVISRELLNAKPELIEFLQIYYCDGLIYNLSNDGYGYYQGCILQYYIDYEDKLLLVYEMLKTRNTRSKRK